jgi:hypothetical protein
VECLLLDDRCLERGIFNPRTVKDVVEAHLDGRRNHTFLLMALMIFEVGQREFLDGDRTFPASGPDVPGPRAERPAYLIHR